MRPTFRVGRMLYIDILASSSMEITSEKIGELNIKVAITLDSNDYQSDFDAALKTYRKRVTMPGFRVGHVPMSLVKKMYGKSILAEELNKKLNNQLYDHITNEKLSVLGNPIPMETTDDEGDWDNPGSFTFSYEMGLAPEIETQSALKTVPLRYKVSVDDKMLNEHIEDMTRRFGNVNAVETSESEDILMATLIQLDAEGSIKAGGFMNDSSVIISEVTDEAARKQLVGLQAGAEVDLDPHTLTKSHDDLGKMLGITHHDVHHLEGNVRIRVSEVKRLEKHAIDQDLFDRVLGPNVVSNEEDFRSNLSEELAKMFDRDAQRFFRNELYKNILENMAAPLPEGFLKRWMVTVSENGITEDEVEVQYPEYAKYVRWQLFEERIMHENNIEVTQQDIVNEAKAQLAMQYARYGMPLDDEMLSKFAQNVLSDRKEFDRLQQSLRENRVFEALEQSVTTIEKAVNYDEFLKIIEAASKND